MKAFPTNIKVATGGDGWRTDYGMDLRDYFAAKALNGMISSKNWFSGTNWESVESMANMYSHEAYAFADAMMKVRTL